jgi:hypothetical protein
MEIEKLFITLALKASEYTKGLDQATTDGIRWAANYGSQVAAGIRKAFLGGILVITTALIGLGVAGVSAASDLEAQMSGVQAVLGATAEEMSELKGLTQDLALDERLKVSATEAADAIEMLAQNGLTVTEIMGGAAEATVLLQNATGGDFATAANIASNAMAVFGVKADNMISAVDGIVGVTNASQFTIEDYGLALAQAGGVAATVGVEIEDFNATLAAISPSFSSGSDAGTSFKTMLTRLIPQSDEAKTAMQELGLITFNNQEAMSLLSRYGIQPVGDDALDLADDVYDLAVSMGVVEHGTKGAGKQFSDYLDTMGLMQNQFYDAEGNLKSMAEITDVLSGATAGLTEEQKSEYLATIFGSDAMRAAAGIANMTGIEFLALQAQMGMSADQVYALGKQLGLTDEEMMSLQEDMASFVSASEAAAIRVDNLTGDMDIFSGIVEALNMQVGNALLPHLRVFVQLGTQLLSTFGPKMIAAFGELVGIFASFVGDIAPGVIKFFSVLANGGTPILAVVNALRAIGASQETINTVRTTYLEFMNLHGAALSAAASLFELQDVLIALGVVLVASFLPAILPVLGTILAIAVVVGVLVAGIALFREISENGLVPTLEKLSQIFGVDLVAAYEKFKAIMEPVGNFLQSVFNAAVAALTPALDNARQSLGLISEKITEFQPVLQFFGNIFMVIAQVVGVIVVGAFLLFLGLAIAVFNGVIEAIVPLVDMFFWMMASIEIIMLGIWQYIEGALEMIVALFTGSWEDVDAASQKMREGLLTIIGGVVMFIISAFAGMFGTVLTYAGSFFTSVINFFTTLYEELTGKKVPEIVDGIKKWFNETDWAALGRAVIDGILSAFLTGGSEIAAAAKAIAQSAYDAIANYWEVNSPSKKMMKLWGWIMEGGTIAVDDSIPEISNAANLSADALAAPFEQMAANVGTMTPAGGDVINNGSNSSYTYNNYGAAAADPRRWFEQQERLQGVPA